MTTENKTNLTTVLERIGEEYKENIHPTSRTYVLVDIGAAGKAFGHTDVAEKYKSIVAVIPVKRTEGGLNIQVNGKDFVDYRQLDSGIAVIDWVAQDAQLPHKQYVPRESMIMHLKATDDADAK